MTDTEEQIVRESVRQFKRDHPDGWNETELRDAARQALFEARCRDNAAAERYLEPAWAADVRRVFRPAV